MSKLSVATVNLEIYEPVIEASGERIALSCPDAGELSYSKLLTSRFECEKKYNHFSVPLNEDGSPWLYGSLYLVQKLDSVRKPKSRTLSCIASDLQHFRSAIEELGLDYLQFPKRKLRRPTYQYRSYLQNQLSKGKLSPSTASRRMSSVIGFYRWLKEQPGVDFDYAVWIEKDVQVSFRNSIGYRQSVKVKSTDLKVDVPKNRNDYSEFIEDGGKLRPLPKDEQEVLVEALVQIGNPEMLLAFYIALISGARIQTVFTLRRKNFTLKMLSKSNELLVPVGYGTGVDTKYQTRMMIHIPRWLVLKIQTYMNSKRALNRVSLSRHYLNEPDNQYLFLTQSGKPYYLAEDDPMGFLYKTPPSGGAVRQFKMDRLNRKLREGNVEIDFKFHDLRATFGMNLLEQKLATSNKDRNKLLDVLMYIKERMGHSEISTTEVYLDYRKNNNIAMYAQSEFEAHLESIMRNV